MPVFARRERRRLHHAVVEKVRPHLATDFDDVAKAFGGDQSGDGAAPLDDEIGRHRRAVADVADLRRRDLVHFEEVGDALLYRQRRIARRGRHLVIADLPVFLA